MPFFSPTFERVTHIFLELSSSEDVSRAVSLPCRLDNAVVCQLFPEAVYEPLPAEKSLLLVSDLRLGADPIPTQAEIESALPGCQVLSATAFIVDKTGELSNS